MSDERILSTAALDMLCLCGCALTHRKPSHDRLAQVNWQALYALSKYHKLVALVCEGLELAEFAPPEADRKYFAAFRTAKEKSVRKNLLLDSERARLFAFLEENGIWYLPLKGIVLKELYPKMGLRQMVDNDILFDGRYRETVRNWFTAEGYCVAMYDRYNHDAYEKEPVYNFEMHVSLFDQTHNAPLVEYYRNVEHRLLGDGQTTFGRRLSDEDFYCYFLAHGFKHYDQGGMSLRFLMDIFIYLEKKQPSMNRQYLDCELEKLGLLDFEKACRELLDVIFSDPEGFCFESLSSGQQKMLGEFIHYGTETRIARNLEKTGKLRYLCRRLFPNASLMRGYSTVFMRHKWLLPFGWIYRGFHLLFTKSDSSLKEILLILKSKRS